MTQTDIDLITALAAGSIIYGKQFNPQISLKALVYFEGGDLRNLPKKVNDYLMTVTKNIEIDKIPFRVAELQKTQRAK